MSAKLHQRLTDKLGSTLTSFSFTSTTGLVKQHFFDNRIAKIAFANKQPQDLMSWVKQCSCLQQRSFTFKSNPAIISQTCRVFSTSPIILQSITLFQTRSLARSLALWYYFQCQRCRRHLEPTIICLLQVLTILLSSISSSFLLIIPILQVFSLWPKHVYCYNIGPDTLRSQFLSLYLSNIISRPQSRSRKETLYRVYL